MTERAHGHGTPSAGHRADPRPDAAKADVTTTSAARGARQATQEGGSSGSLVLTPGRLRMRASASVGVSDPLFTEVP